MFKLLPIQNGLSLEGLSFHYFTSYIIKKEHNLFVSLEVDCSNVGVDAIYKFLWICDHINSHFEILVALNMDFPPLVKKLSM